MKTSRPARKITKNYRSLTGVHNNVGNPHYSDFESSLERDFFLLLEFDREVQQYKAQPLTIVFENSGGETKEFTPDALVTTKNPDKGIVEHTLYEVKYREQLKDSWSEFKPRFKAAIRFAKLHGWKFKIITEKEIRTPYLDNITFLKPHFRETRFSPRAFQILEYLAEVGESTPRQIIESMSSHKMTQAELLFAVWQLVARQYILADLTVTLTMNSRIKVAKIWEGYVHEE
ncbi:TnsA endonuclease N-terminal domain-containing protein [Kangiella shandongensis]|uniref:TnsA endonuclease N-terminal domain-containing protein n=1 Tax=Kangiella shandongensis TaxID=2763258 RepID=UPI001CC0F4F5|nr:TnsA endonuclease N-terminal domain-containing protein [Kangiella shandongensis]